MLVNQLFAAVATLAVPTLAVVNYANQFSPPDSALFNNYTLVTVAAEQTIIQWAESLAKEGPWSVTNTNITPPSGNKNDYMSIAPYYWPDCSGAGNTTVMDFMTMFKTCNYTNFDGKLNPDARLVNNVGDFDDMANAILYNSLSWAITRSSTYSNRVATYVKTWFVDDATKMNPNLNFAQMQGGPTGQVGTHTGMLDLKSMAKIATGVLVLRDGSADGWDDTVDAPFKSWVSDYISWFTTTDIALQEKAATNNHGSFYFTQLASLYLISGDLTNSAATIKEYFDGIYQNQIAADGDQPLESARTRPYHYLTYNLAAIVTNAEIGRYAGYDAWDTKAASGSGVQEAAKFAMSYPVGDDTASELYPVLATIGAHYNDPNGEYSAFLQNATQGAYVSDASYYWSQPLSNSSAAAASAGTVTFLAANSKPATLTLSNSAPTGGTGSGSSSSPSASGKASGASMVVPAYLAVSAGLVAAVML